MSSQQGGRPRQQTGQSDEVRHALFGVAVYGVFAVVTFVYSFLQYVLVSEESRYFNALEEDTFFQAIEIVFSTGSSIFGVLIAFGIGVYYYVNTGPRESSFQPAAIAAAAGAAAVLIVSLILLTITAPDRIDVSLGDELAGVLVSLLSIALAAVLAAVALDRQAPT